MAAQLKSPGTDDDDFWNQSLQNAFNFDDNEEGFVEFVKSSAPSSSKTTSERPKSVSLPKSSSPIGGLKMDHETAQKQMLKCLNSMQLNEKTSQLTNVTLKMNPKDAIICMIKGDNIQLNMFKGKDEKLQMLDYAIKSHDGNIITKVIIFLQKTLKPSLFNHELGLRPEAADHYVSYLRKCGQLNDLNDVLTMLGRDEDAAMIKYMQSIGNKTVDTKIRNLKNCLQNHFTTGSPNVIFWSSLISEQISLLERQLPIESDDSRQENQSQQNQFSKIPRRSLLNLPVITTLYYCCLYHYELPENHFASPKAIVKAYQLSRKQFEYTAIAALCKLQRWSDIDSIFEVKSFLGNKTIKSSISFERIVKLLKKNDAPEEMIMKYFEKIEDSETKFVLSKELKMHRAAIDTLIKLRDRKRLDDYIAKLSPHTKEYGYGENALRINTIRWKN